MHDIKIPFFSDNSNEKSQKMLVHFSLHYTASCKKIMLM